MGREALRNRPASHADRRLALSLRLALGSALAMMLAACAQGDPAAAPAAQGPGAIASLDEASCRGAGGSLLRAGKRQMLQCIISYADAGRSCSSGSDCAGDCRAPDGVEKAPGQKVAGYCQATSDRFGCSTRVEQGRAQPTICID
jgi:hypothetical protein